MHLSRFTLFAALAAVSPLAAQTLEPGYRVALQGVAATSPSVITVLDDASLVYFAGSQLVLEDGTSSPRVLLDLGAPVFASFAVQVTASDVLFGESSTGGVWRVPFRGGGAPVQLATLAFNFAAARYDDVHALVSAKAGGFATPNNDVFAVDLATGAVDAIADLPGASGPVEFDEDGNLYYATSSLVFPSPLGGVEVLRFDAALVQSAFGPGVLTRADAVVAFAGLDAATSLAFDGDGDLFYVDFINNVVGELSDLAGPAPRQSVLFDYTTAPLSPTSVQFVRGAVPTAAVFEPYQPAAAGALAVFETDFFSTGRLRLATAARAVTAVPSSVPRGRFSVVTTGAPANAVGLMGWALPASVATPELALPVGGEAPLFWGLAGFTVPLPAFFDASGVHRFDFFNPGLHGVGLAIQVAFVDLAGGTIGSAAPVTTVFQ